jgi:hypothetical protein
MFYIVDAAYGWTENVLIKFSLLLRDYFEILDFIT